MSAVDEIEAAIAKLTEARSAATAGTWIYTDDTRGEFGYSANITVNGWDVVSGRGGDLDPDLGDREAAARANAQLVVILHRTIDAQLEVLRVGMPHSFPNGFSPIFQPALTLARAINGTRR